MTASHPFAAACIDEKSRTSPTTSSQPRFAMRSIRDVRRTRQRTSKPRARSMRTTTEPMKPLPPVVRIFITLHQAKFAGDGHDQENFGRGDRNDTDRGVDPTHASSSNHNGSMQ